MKKIFAIALALVMVLSMASAFAFCAGEHERTSPNGEVFDMRVIDNYLHIWYHCIK